MYDGYYYGTGFAILSLLSSLLLLIAQIAVAVHFAEKKGRTPWKFGLLTFFTGPFGLALLALVEDRSYQYTTPSAQSIGNNSFSFPESTEEPDKPKDTKKVYVRNCFINIPLRPCQADILLDDNVLLHTIDVKAYDGSKPSNILVRIEGYDVFEQQLYQIEKSVGALHPASGGFSFRLEMPNDAHVDFQAICYLEVYILQYAVGMEVFSPAQLIRCEEPVPIKDLETLKKEYGIDAVTPLQKTEAGWTCVCGNPCVGKECDICHRREGDIQNSSGRISFFLDELMNMQTPQEIREKFSEIKDIVDGQAVQKVEKCLDNADTAKRMYGVDIGEKEKKEIAEILR